MPKFNSYLAGHDETIAAVSTPPGIGGIGIVRISGPDAFSIGCAIFQPRHGASSFQPQTRKMYLGNIVDPQNAQNIDEVLWVYFAGPNSFTTQDMVEIQCHGGAYSTNRILEITLNQGCRLAEPGEFSCRAVLGGRLKLSQAEAVCQMIESKTGFEAKAAFQRLKGDSYSHMEKVTRSLTEIAAGIEVGIDFPDEIPPEEEIGLLKGLQSASESLHKWHTDYLKSKIYFEGALVVICGAPNVGKSSLFNCLIGSQRNIVSPEPGTTRDMVEAEIVIDGMRCKLVDTAGLGEAAGSIEAMGMEISRETISRADLVIEVLDASQPHLPGLGGSYSNEATSGLIRVLNKKDLGLNQALANIPEDDHPVVQTSALKNLGIDELKSAITAVLRGTNGNMPLSGGALNHRQALEVESALSHLKQAELMLESGIDQLDMVSIEIHSAIQGLKRAQGLDYDDEVIQQVFSKFCVGK